MYLVGRFIKDTEYGAVWDFQGIFSSKDHAILACRDSYYFYAKVQLNEELKHETKEWIGVVYPIEGTA